MMFIILILEKLIDGENPRDVLDSRTGMYKLREYKPKTRLPTIREFKPKNREFKPREFEPRKVNVHTYDKLRKYDHFYDAEPPEDESNRPPGVGSGLIRDPKNVYSSAQITI
jgi:hypothetical protein